VKSPIEPSWRDDCPELGVVTCGDRAVVTERPGDGTLVQRVVRFDEGPAWAGGNVPEMACWGEEEVSRG
jgi:hypothetical protein